MKKTVLKAGFKDLKNEEWFNFHLEFKGIVMQATPGYLGVENRFAQYLEWLEKADEVQALLEDSDRFDGFIRTLNVNIERYKHRRRHRKNYEL